MTGGGLALALVTVPGSGTWFKGGVVAYDSAVKYELLGVTPGPVICASAATEMATGVARLLHADVGVATTGCSGPEPMEGQPIGTLWVGVSIDGRLHASKHHLVDEDADEIRAAATAVALADACVFLRSATHARAPD